MNTTPYRTLPGIFTTAFVAIFLIASCNGDSEQSDVSLQSDTMSITVPGFIRSIRSLSDAELELEISIEGEVTRRIRATNEDSVNVSLRIPKDKATNIGFAWYALVSSSQRVLLADQQDTIPAGTEDTQFSITSYISSGDSRFDVDSDGRTSLSEVRDNRNPLSAVDYQVPFSTADFLPANIVVTGDGVDEDTSDTTPETDQDSTFSIWHNGVNLNVYVCGQDQTLSEASAQYWHDDTIFIFFDGANDDSSVYDGVDDFQFAFVRSTEGLIVSKGSTNTFCPNGDCVSYSFFSNATSCEYEFSAQFPLASLNISSEPGATFGFDIEFTDDDDGGLRDDSAAWIGFDDRSDIDPSTFGTMQLQD